MSEDELQAIVDELVDRVETLEQENTELREMVEERTAVYRWATAFRKSKAKELQNAVAELQGREMLQDGRLSHVVVTTDVDPWEMAELESLDEYTTMADPEQLLPIQQLELSRRVGFDGLKDNERRAAIVWGNFAEKADPSRGTLSLSSAKVRTILDDAGESTHTETVARAMDRVAEFSKGLVEVEKHHQVNYLVADLDEWEEVMDEVAAEIRQQETVLDGQEVGE